MYLVINEGLCVGCDNCEKACAETHGGISRLDRKSGATFAQVHIPISCRHCEQPHCMKDCPPNAIKRSANGEVFIDDTCIGCGNCQVNCPYGVIRMAYEAPKKPGLLSWLLFGSGPGVGEEHDYHPTSAAKAKGKKATKCDACGSVSNGPACVKACPTGAAVRIGPIAVPGSCRSAAAMIHQSILRYGGARYAWWALGLSGASAALYSTQRGRQQPGGGTWQGYVLGSMGPC